MQANKVMRIAVLALGGLLISSAMTLATPTRGKNHGDRAATKLSKLSSKLNLTEDQKSKIKPILQNEAKQTEGIRANNALSQDQKHTRIKEIHQTTRSEMRPILTAQQQQKLDQIRKQKRAERRSARSKPAKG